MPQPHHGGGGTLLKATALHYLMQKAKLWILGSVELDIIKCDPREQSSGISICHHGQYYSIPECRAFRTISGDGEASGNLQSPSRLSPSLGLASKQGYFTFSQQGGCDAAGREKENGCSQSN